MAYRLWSLLQLYELRCENLQMIKNRHPETIIETTRIFSFAMILECVQAKALRSTINFKNIGMPKVPTSDRVCCTPLVYKCNVFDGTPPPTNAILPSCMN